MTPDEVYRQFIEPAEGRLIAAAWRVLGDEHQADDALQEAMVRIWEHRAELQSHPNREAWMLRIVLNAACDMLRRRRGAEQVQELGQLADPAPTLARLEDVETRRRIFEEIACLSPQQGQAVLLRLVEGLPYNAVASALGCTEATARVHVQRGREKLCARLAELDPRFCVGAMP